MKTNANDPIKPVILRQIGEGELKLASEKDLKEGIYLSSKMGLTKLEHFSAMAMQGILANPFYAERFAANNGAPCVPDLAKMAIEQAKALINELNKVEP